MKYFREIDTLRALAVFAVILNHFDARFLTGGYLGVDIFFVVSGFVVSASLNSYDATLGIKGFLKSFYSKRFKRLYPALMICLLFSLALTLLLISDPKFYTHNALWVLFASGNIFLSSHASDYFQVSAQTNPFTHMWSLGVEEQFYLFLPIIFFFVRNKKLRMVSLWVLAILSFLVFIYLKIKSPNHAFYLMPSRFWQFIIGVLIYEADFKKLFKRLSPHLIILPLAGIVLCLFVVDGFRVSTTVFVTFLTGITLILIKESPEERRYLVCQPVLYLGMMSYSLYLFHWPILVFTKRTIGLQSVAIVVLVAVCIFSVAWLSYQLEKGLRYQAWNRGHFGAIVVVIAAIIVLNRHTPAVSEKIFLGNEGAPYAKGFEGEDLDYERCYGDVVVNALQRYEDFVSTYKKCSYLQGNLKGTMYIYGSSHAEQMLPMLYQYAKEENYQYHFIGRGGLPLYFKNFIHRDEKYFNKSIPASVLKNYLKYVLEYGKSGDIAVISTPLGFFNGALDDRDNLLSAMDAQNLFFSDLKRYISIFEEKKISLFFINGYPFLKESVEPELCIHPWSQFNKNCDINSIFASDNNDRMRMLDRDYESNLGKNYLSLWKPFEELIRKEKNPAVLYYNPDHFNTLANEGLYPVFHRKINERLKL